jgi:uncharacterized protein with HEPN domain
VTGKPRSEALYFRVDLDVVWDVVTNDLPPLREHIAALLGR